MTVISKMNSLTASLLYITIYRITSTLTNTIDDITAHQCRYIFHINSLSWDEARAVCMREGRTLARIDTTSEVKALVTMASETVSKMLEKGSTQLENTLWIGLRAESSGNDVTRRWADCDVASDIDSLLNPQELSHEGCFGMELKTSKSYRIYDCTISKQFLCEDTTPGAAKCWMETSFPEAHSSDFTETNSIDKDVGDWTYTAASECASEYAGFKGDHSVTYFQYNTHGNIIPVRYPTCFMKAYVNYETSIHMTSYMSGSFCATSAPSSSPVMTSSVDDNEFATSSPDMTYPSSTVWSLEVSSFASIDSSNQMIASEPPTTVPFSLTEVTSLDVLKSSSTTAASVSPGTSDIPTPALSSVPEEVFTSSGKIESSDEISPMTSSSLSSSTLIVSSHEYDNSGGLSIITNTMQTQPANTCYCTCSRYSSTSYTPDEVQEKIESITKELTVDKKDTSAYKRKLTSAPDDRKSAQNIGYVGILILSLCGTALVVLDIPVLLKQTKKLFGSLFQCFRR